MQAAELAFRESPHDGYPAGREFVYLSFACTSEPAWLSMMMNIVIEREFIHLSIGIRDTNLLVDLKHKTPPWCGHNNSLLRAA